MVGGYIRRKNSTYKEGGLQALYNTIKFVWWDRIQSEFAKRFLCQIARFLRYSRLIANSQEAVGKKLNAFLSY